VCRNERNNIFQLITFYFTYFIGNLLFSILVYVITQAFMYPKKLSTCVRFTELQSVITYIIKHSSNASCLIQGGGVQTYSTEAETLVYNQRLSCKLPLTPRHPLSTQPYYTWTVSISNNNENFSNEVQLFVYDSKCLECHSSTADSCEQKVKL